jgi:hypothetical protein
MKIRKFRERAELKALSSVDEKWMELAQDHLQWQTLVLGALKLWVVFLEKQRVTISNIIHNS